MAKAARNPARSMRAPAATGPTTFASAGASPSQLNTRMRSVPSAAMWPAVRWIVMRPMFDPAPVSVAATHIAR